MGFGSNLFHSYGKFVRRFPFAICGFWFVLLLVAIICFPLRAEQAENIIDMWIPEDGKIKYSVDFADDLYKEQSYYKEMNGLPEMIDRLDANDDFWRGNDDYFHIWAQDKTKRGNSLDTKAHVKEWYEFSLELQNMKFLVDGKNQTWHDVCLFQYATNADYYHRTNPGDYFFPGYQPGFAMAGGVDNTGVVGAFWDSVIKTYPETLNGKTPNMHLQFHSLAVVEATKANLFGALTSPPFSMPTCSDTLSWPSCAIDVGLLDQDSYNKNCYSLMAGLNSIGRVPQSILDLYGTNANQLTPNEWTTLCSSFLVYASLDGITDFESTCFVSDVSFCIQDAIGEYYGSLFAAPLTEPNYGSAYHTIPTEADMIDPNLSDAEFMNKLQTCGFLSLTREATGKYYRTSKYVVEPVVLARRLQQIEGNCNYSWPSTAETKAVYEASYTEDLRLAEEALYAKLPALAACAVIGSDTLLHLQELVANLTAATIANDATAIGSYQQQIGAITTVEPYATYGATCMTISDTLEADQVALADLLAAEGAAALGFTVWYKSQAYWTCPDFDEATVQRALDVRQTVNDQLFDAVNNFNDRAQYIQASVLSDDTVEDGYGNLFTQNAILIVVGITVMVIFVVCVNYKNWKAALLSMFLNLMCVFATLGLMEMPFTPSVVQFLPYLMIGIGVDDLFVVLFHYIDEDNVPKTLHHAGMTITITSMTNVIVFVMFRFLTSVPDIRIFTGAAAIGMALLYGNIFFGVVPVLYIIEWQEGRDVDATRTKDNFEDDGVETFGENAFINYTKAKKFLSPCKNVFAMLFIVVVFIAMTTVACMKIAGSAGFEQPEFGLKMSELIEEDEGEHLYRAVTVFEDFPLFVFSCGAAKEDGESTSWNGEQFDTYAPRFREMCNDFDGIKGTFRSSQSWSIDLPDAGDQPHPFYTNVARQFPQFPDPSIFWYDQDRYTRSEIIVPQATFINVPEAFDGRTSADTISNFYDVIDNYSDIGAFCTSTVIEVFERYIGVEKNLLFSVGVTLLVVFLIALMIIQDIGAVLVLTFVDACTAFQLWGFFSILGLRMNNVLILNIMFGAAFMVQYTAHLARRFVISPCKSRYFCAVDALSLYAGPLLWGALSTALAVSVAAFLPIKYFRLYYFRAFVIIVVFGLFNGLVVQSALLVLIPTSFATANLPMFGEEESEKTVRRRFSSDGNATDLGIQLGQMDTKIANVQE